MGVDAFVLRFDFEGGPFATQFLASAGFTTHQLKAICRELGLPSSTPRKNELAKQIAEVAGYRGYEAAQSKVIQHLTARNTGWLSLKQGRIPKYPRLCDPRELVIRPGEEQWYGPTICPDDVVTARWYIHPVFVDHWEPKEDKPSEARKLQIRWLCFARVTRDVLSLHWRGFSHSHSPTSAGGRNTQFSYWEQVPHLFESIENLTGADVVYPNLHRLILHRLWDQYREDEDYEWIDRRIRAKASGVSFNARAGAVYEIEAGGILHLARTIRRSIETELRAKGARELPDPGRFDDVILRTLIREYGTLSYEFSLERNQDVIFRGHTYFGLGTYDAHRSRDSFPSINLHISQRRDLEQMGFLLRHLKESPGEYERDRPEPLRLF